MQATMGPCLEKRSPSSKEGRGFTDASPVGGSTLKSEGARGSPWPGPNVMIQFTGETLK